MQLWGGVPAHLIRYRFNEKQIESLTRIAWWNNEDEWILNMRDLFKDVNKFIEIVDKLNSGL